MNDIADIKNTLFYNELRSILETELPKIEEEIKPGYELFLKEMQFKYPLPLFHQLEYTPWGTAIQWRLELDFDDYEWSHETVKPHYLGASFSVEIARELLHFKFQMFNSFNELLKAKDTEQITMEESNNTSFVDQKLMEVKTFLTELPTAFFRELKQVNFRELEYITNDEDE